MKNSAWYHKLWRKRVDEFPIQEDAHASWHGMQQLLDEHMPVAKISGGKKSKKSVGSTIVSMLGFILPAAAMIGTITFVAVKHSLKHKQEVQQHHQHNLKKQGGAFTDSASLATDSALTAVAPATDIQTASTGKGPGQLASLNVIAASSGYSQPAGSTASNTSAKHVSLQLNNQALAEARPAYSILEYPPQPASLFPIETPDSAQLSNQLWQGISGDRNSLLAMVNQGPSERSGAAIKSDQDGIAVNDPAVEKSEKSKSGSEKKLPKIKIKTSRYKTPRLAGDSSRLGIGLLSGLNWSGSTGNLFVGLSLSYQIQDQWRLNTGITLNINQYIISTYQHASFAPRDTNVSFTIKDQRKAQQVLTIPLTLEYAISKRFSINAGPQVSITSQPKRVVKPSEGRSAYILNVPNRIDTLNHGHSIDTALNLTTINKFNIGISGGISIHLNRHLHIDARYQQNITPYLFNNSYLGNSKVYYHSVQIGLRYQFGN